MTPVEVAEVRPELLDFTAEMLGGLARKDQRAAGELYVRGLLAGLRRVPDLPGFMQYAVAGRYCAGCRHGHATSIM